MDDVLGGYVRRGGLCAEDAHEGHCGLMTGLDFQIQMNQEQQVQLLALVFVQALGLNGEHGHGVDGDTLVLVQPFGKRGLVFQLDGGKARQEGNIIGEGQQLFKFGRILLEAAADVFFDQACQFGIALEQPSAEGDAVGLVVELLGLECAEMLQLTVLQDLAVQRCNAVDAVGKMNVHVRHVHGVPLVDDCGGFIIGAVAGDLIQLFDDGH